MFISYITLLPIDNPNALAFDIVIVTKPILVRLNVIELEDVAILTKVSNEFIIVVSVFFYFSFLTCCFGL